MDLPSELRVYLEDWKTEYTVAFALLGSYARGDAGPHSDLDILHFVDDDKHEADARSLLIDAGPGGTGRNGNQRALQYPRRLLVVLSTVTPSQVESWFSDPGLALNIIVGLRDGRPLWDPKGIFAAIQQRAVEFKWTPALQEKADQLAGKELVGWIEEAHKGLEGLRRNDTGRLLNARFGLSWGLAWVMRLHKGVLATSDNTFFSDVVNAVGPETEWAKLLHRAFGVAVGDEDDSFSLRDEVTSGLLLYCETFSFLKEALPGDDFALIEATAARIRRELKCELASSYEDSRGPTS
ncbi:MAG: nucleotidyltransferase domain-containing protein [Caldilineaceae bacterium]|nr:nucleotidyltransferase domain-containing protein [Caldilineaceae bacterium]MDE0336842.1 nucleotidyltransferase domain-containing protein [Caldilineaceae bacterium]